MTSLIIKESEKSQQIVHIIISINYNIILIIILFYTFFSYFKKMSEIKSKEPSKHWSMKQDKQFLFNLIIYYDQTIKTGFQKAKIFQKMASWINGKDNRKCQTHYSNKVKNIKNGRSVKYFQCMFKTVIYNMIDVLYNMRHVSVNHMETQIYHYLQTKVQGQKLHQHLHNLNQFMQNYSVQFLENEDILEQKKHNPEDFINEIWENKYSKDEDNSPSDEQFHVSSIIR